MSSEPFTQQPAVTTTQTKHYYLRELDYAGTTINMLIQEPKAKLVLPALKFFSGADWREPANAAFRTFQTLMKRRVLLWLDEALKQEHLSGDVRAASHKLATEMGYGNRMVPGVGWFASQLAHTVHKELPFYFMNSELYEEGGVAVPPSYRRLGAALAGHKKYRIFIPAKHIWTHWLQENADPSQPEDTVEMANILINCKATSYGEAVAALTKTVNMPYFPMPGRFRT